MPIAGTRLFVLDAWGEVAVPGAPGWLYIGGGAVSEAAGLRARTGTPDPRFIDDPWAPTGRAFRTGERARRRADRGVEVLATEPGRLYRRGRVVSLDAIATALCNHPSIVDAAVTVRSDAYGDARPVACVVPVRGVGYTDTELRRHVRAVLPEVAVPQHFVELDVIARASDGAPMWDRMTIVAPWEAARTTVLPSTPSEHFIAAVWQEMLGVPGLHATDTFFDLGGHSLLCFRLIDRVMRERGVRINPRIVLLGTLEQVAAELDAGCQEREDAVVPRAEPASARMAVRPAAGVFGRLKRVLGGAA